MTKLFVKNTLRYLNVQKQIITNLNYSTISERNLCTPSRLPYFQGQFYKSNIKEYFFYIDKNGMLFLDDDPKKNNTSVINNKKFLEFFFKRLHINTTDRYGDKFPYIIYNDNNRNYLRCECLPIVYTQLYNYVSTSLKLVDSSLSYCGAEQLLTINFQPNQLFLSPVTGFIYHPAKLKHGQIGILSPNLRNALKSNFLFKYGNNNNNNSKIELPSHFLWNSIEHKLDNNWFRNIINYSKL